MPAGISTARHCQHEYFSKNPDFLSCIQQLFVNMSKEKRSKGACWTCSFRRKKCDEALPICSVCASLSVPCFGYERNPSWADGGEKQKAKAEELRIIIRESAALRRRQAKQKQQMVATNPKFKNKKVTKGNDIRASIPICYENRLIIS